MNGRRKYGLLAVAAAVLVVGLVWAGVPASRLLVFGLILVCPLMMFAMMSGMGHGGGTDRPDAGLRQRRDDNHHDRGR